MAMKTEIPKIEPAAPMYAVVRLDNRGTPFIDGITVDFDVSGLHRRLQELHEVAPTYEAISPIVAGPNGETVAVVEIRFVRWLGEQE